MSEETIFVTALEKATPAERAAYLESACAGDPELRRRVEALLRAHEQSGDLLDPPVQDPGPLTEPAGAAVRSGDGRPITEGPGSRIGPYQIVRKVGEGGMGVVFLAEQGSPVRRTVALKVIKPGMDSAQVVARLEVERQALALMEHPHIAKFLDAGTTDSGRPYFVMEPVDGAPITEYCDRNRLTPRGRLELFVSACRAIQHAHQKGVIHRDIKPSNVLVTLQDGRPVPKVIDFGVAKAIDQRLTERTLFTQLGAVVGTPEYMSPEQAKLSGLDVDTRSDIYSLGVLLYELLTGTTPLERRRLREAAFTEVLRRIREEEPPKPSARLSTTEETASIAASRGTEPTRLARQVRGDLDWIVMKALEKEPARRYETADGLARDIERHLGGDPVEAGPPSAAYRLRKLARKHRAALATATAFAAVLVVATAISTWQAIRARQAEARARRDRDAAIAARSAEAEARRRAEAAEKAARTEAEKARAINRFLTDDLLSQAEPEHNPVDTKVTLLEVLDRAAERVGDRFRAQPEVEAAVRRTIAGAYHDLGVFDRGERHWRSVAELERRRSGPDSAEAWTAQARAGHAQDHLGRHAEAIAELSRARDALARLRGPDHPETLDAMDYLATANREAGRLPEAISLHEQVARLRAARLGPDHRDTLVALHNLAGAYEDAGRSSEALALFETVVKRSEATLGHDHPHTLNAISSLSQIYLSAGRFAEAVPLFEEVLRLQKSRLGAEHVCTIAAMSNLAAAYRAAGRTSEALPLFEQSLAIMKAKYGLDHPTTLITMRNLSVIYREAGRHDEALALSREVLGLMKAKHGPDHPDTLIALHNLATFCSNAGRLDEAIPLFEEVVRLRKAKLGPDHPFTLLSTDGLVRVYLRQRRWAEAEAAARECLDGRTRTQPDDWSRFQTSSLLGAALAGQKKYAEAEPFLIDGYEGLKAREASIPAPSRGQLAAAAARIVPLYEAWGRPDKAAEWRRSLGTPDARPSKP
jgi:eukaryotic-like serine/threonine-protein kinase